MSENVQCIRNHYTSITKYGWNTFSLYPVILSSHIYDYFDLCITNYWFQNEFVEIGGVNTLMFALHSTDTHIVKESLLAICQLCQDNEDVMVHVLGENG